MEAGGLAESQQDLPGLPLAAGDDQPGQGVQEGPQGGRWGQRGLYLHQDPAGRAGRETADQSGYKGQGKHRTFRTSGVLGYPANRSRDQEKSQRAYCP